MNSANPPSLLADAWSELRRRKVVRAGAAYAVAAWVVLQLGEITFEPLGLPPRALTWTILGAILGFPIVLVLAWFFDLGPQGLTRDRSRSSRVGSALAVLLVLLTVAGIGSWLTTLYADVEPAAATAATPSAVENSIAVLPFADMSADHSLGHLGDGIAEELLDRLARNRQLRVAARTSSFALRHQSADIKQIGQLLNVRWVVEGSVRQAGSRLRFTAQLIDAHSGFHQWSETYERDNADWFALQDEVTEAIAAQLRDLISLESAAPTTLSGQESNNVEAHQAFLRGRQMWRQRSPASLAEAEALFQKAVSLDPEFARAWAGLADTWLLQSDYGDRPLEQAIQLAEPAAVRAVSLAPDLGEAWASLGLLRMNARQFSAAERSLREAMRLDPRYEMAPMWLAAVLGRRGELAEQLRVLQQAQQLNPLEPVINLNLAQALTSSGQADEAERVLQRMLAITPEHPMLLRGLADIEVQRGELAAALRHARAALADDSTAPTSQLSVLRVMLLLGDFSGAQSLLEQSRSSSEFRLILRQWIAAYSAEPRWLPEVKQQVMSMSPTSAAKQPALILISAWACVESAPEDAIRLLQLLGSGQPDGDDYDFEADSLLAALQAQETPLSDAARTAWRRLAEKIASVSGNASTGAYQAATLFALAGEANHALDALERARDFGFIDLSLVRADPRLRALRQHPRFGAVLTSIERRVADERAKAGLG